MKLPQFEMPKILRSRGGFALVAGTVFLAAGSVQLMQPPALAAAQGQSGRTAPAAAQAEPVPSQGQATAALARITQVQTVAARGDLPEVPALPEAPEPARQTLSLAIPQAKTFGRTPLPAQPQAAPSCTPELTLTPAPAAMVDLSLRAPCHGATRLTVSHDGLVFEGRTDDAGRYSVQIPALTADARISVMLDDGTYAGADVQVPEAAAFDRAALQWRGRTGLQIHALENGAGYDGAGHVWSGAPRSTGAAGGFLTALGDPELPEARVAEVYSLPAGKGDAFAALTVEAHIDPATCGRDIAGQALQPDAAGAMRTTEVSLTMPDCDAVGDILVLKNLLRDLKIAHN